MVLVIVQRQFVDAHQVLRSGCICFSERHDDRRRQQIGKPDKLESGRRRSAGGAGRVAVDIGVGVRNQLDNGCNVEIVERNDARLKALDAERMQAWLRQHELCSAANLKDRSERGFVHRLRTHHQIIRFGEVQNNRPSRPDFGQGALHGDLTRITQQSRQTLVTHFPFAPFSVRMA